MYWNSYMKLSAWCCFGNGGSPSAARERKRTNANERSQIVKKWETGMLLLLQSRAAGTIDPTLHRSLRQMPAANHQPIISSQCSEAVCHTARISNENLVSLNWKVLLGYQEALKCLYDRHSDLHNFVDTLYVIMSMVTWPRMVAWPRMVTSNHAVN